MPYNEGADLLDYLQNPEVFQVRDGYIDYPKLPGLGILINEEKVREISAKRHDWKNPIWRNSSLWMTKKVFERKCAVRQKW